MKIKTNIIILTVMSIVLGYLIATHIKTISETTGKGLSPNQRSQQIAVELKKAQKEKEIYEETIKELELKVNQYELDAVERSSYNKNLFDDLNKYRRLACFTDVEGSGIIMEINDPDEYFDISYGIGIVNNTEILLRIISVLRSAGAEAISINNQRITAYTEIEKAGNHIEINGVSTNTPITIKAIGDSDMLETTLNIKGGIVSQLRQGGYMTFINKEKSVVVQKSRTTIQFKYAQTLEKGQE